MHEISQFRWMPIAHRCSTVYFMRSPRTHSNPSENQAHTWSAASPLAGIANCKFRFSLELNRPAARLPLSKTVGPETAVMKNVPSLEPETKEHPPYPTHLHRLRRRCSLLTNAYVLQMSRRCEQGMRSPARNRSP